MLTEIQYRLVMSSLAAAQGELAKEILLDSSMSDREAISAAMDELTSIDLVKAAWDMTRENVHMFHLEDITDRLRVENPHLRDEIGLYIKTLEWFHVYTEDGDGVKESFMASAGGKAFKDEFGNTVTPSQGIIDACAVLCRKIADEQGVDLSLLSDHSMPNVTQTQSSMPNNVEADIESFKAEMNEIFTTWGGGEQ